MNENLFETQYDVTKKSRFLKYYESNKILIFSVVFSMLFSVALFIYYLDVKENKRFDLLDNYTQANIYLENNDRNEAKDILEKIVLSNDSTYSALSLFLIINENLIEDQEKISELFDYILKNCKFEKEIENLIIYKKALYLSNFVSESELLESLNPLLNKETLWEAHALLLLGDYFFNNNENIKAKEFYMRILSSKNSHNFFIDRARAQLSLIGND